MASKTEALAIQIEQSVTNINATKMSCKSCHGLHPCLFFLREIGEGIFGPSIISTRGNSVLILRNDIVVLREWIYKRIETQVMSNCEF